ncbi:hypothetical protein, partial [Salipiger marinus]|uniref:hypothetical protein n=1 Tax=Salipiger marinus TaxID=555512 RepID=UPI004059BBB9
KRKRPPLNDSERRVIRERAQDMRRELELRRDRLRRDMPRAGDADWLRNYAGLERRVKALLPEAAQQMEGAERW